MKTTLKQGKKNAMWLVAYLEALFEAREFSRYNPASAPKQGALF